MKDWKINDGGNFVLDYSDTYKPSITNMYTSGGFLLAGATYEAGNITSWLDSETFKLLLSIKDCNSVILNMKNQDTAIRHHCRSILKSRQN